MEGEYNVVIKIQEIREKFGIDSANAAPGTRGRQGRVNEFKAKKEAERLAKLANTPSPTSGGGSGAAPQDDTKSAQQMLQTFQDQIALLGTTSDIQRDLLKIETGQS